MNILPINYQPKVVSNNLSRQNQNVNFKGGEGQILVKMLKENKGNLSSEQLGRFIKENFSVFRCRGIRELLEEPRKYIAGLAASIASLTAAKTSLEDENQSLQSENQSLQGENAQLKKDLSEAKKLSEMKDYNNEDIQNMTLDEFREYAYKISEAKQATYIQDLRKKYPGWSSDYFPKEINTYNAKKFNEILDTFKELRNMSYCSPYDWAYYEKGYPSALNDCRQSERLEFYRKARASYEKIYFKYNKLLALLLDKNFDINTKNLNNRSILRIIFHPMLRSFTMNKVNAEYMYDYIKQPDSDLPYVNGYMFLDTVFRNRPDIDPELQRYWERTQEAMSH